MGLSIRITPVENGQNNIGEVIDKLKTIFPMNYELRDGVAFTLNDRDGRCEVFEDENSICVHLSGECHQIFGVLIVELTGIAGDVIVADE